MLAEALMPRNNAQQACRDSAYSRRHTPDAALARLKFSPVMLTMSEWWRMRSSIAHGEHAVTSEDAVLPKPHQLRFFYQIGNIQGC
jgi:hypothetical protein